MRSSRGTVRRLGRALGALVVTAAVAVTAPSAAAAEDDEVTPPPLVAEDLRIRMSDGAELQARLGGRAGPDGTLPPRPTVIELSPYGDGCCADQGGDALNHLFVQIRGTGDSTGRFDALGPRTQQDLAEVMAWACDQPWSAGRLGLYGFSASAIVVYNSLHLELPCFEAAVLGAGTHELYRDLMYPGGVPNGIPALGVLALIGGPALAQLGERLATDPLSTLDVVGGLGETVVRYLRHSSLDGWWRARGWQGNVNDAPVLVVNGFYDVESRGAFEGFQALRDSGTEAHLYVVGAHDGVPAGSGGAAEVTRRWYEHHLLGADNGIDADPRVQLWLSNGDRIRHLEGDVTTLAADDWPVPGTTWVPLHLSSRTSGSAPGTLNDGSLALEPDAGRSVDPYVAVPSLPTATDTPTIALLGVFNQADPLLRMDLPQSLGLAYTTEPFATDVVMAGPASLELALTQVVPESDLWVVLSDVWPDGSAHPVATGRLRTTYPDIDPERSRRDETGAVVQPYNVLSHKRLVAPGTEHRYFVELWPIGNRFQAGHRLRLHVVGASLFSVPTTPGVNLVHLGGERGSVLRVPVLPGSDLPAALGATTGEPTDADAGAHAELGPDAVTEVLAGGVERATPRVAAGGGVEVAGAATARGGDGAGALPATGGATALPLGAVALGLAVVLRALSRRSAPER